MKWLSPSISQESPRLQGRHADGGHMDALQRWPSDPVSKELDPEMIYSLGWFKGKSTGNHGFYH